MIPVQLDGNQETEVSFISGVAANGTLAAQSFWTWNGDSPATYGATDDETKYGPRVAGTGATISFSFDAASAWTATEQAAFKSSMALWSEVANVNFTQVGAGGDFTITRGTDGKAEAGTTRLQPGTVGGTQLGHPTAASLSIDTSVGGFGPIGGPFNEYGGYPYTAMIHELGHILGLGHSGAYDEGVTSTTAALTADDSRAFSIMSYIDPPSSTYGWTLTSVTGVREEGSPVTPQELDILALQRVYGLPTSTPLSGGQTFGFNCNVQGPTESFFDFTQNTQPIISIWDAGVCNTLDASGFSQAQTLNLQSGAFSSVGGLTNNVNIVLGTQIDQGIGGAGADQLIANSDGDTLIGGAGNDTLTGGGGHDVLYGGVGNDSIVGGAASSQLFGGKGDDVVTGTGYLSGDYGNDTVHGLGVLDTIFGGDGNDTLQASGDHSIIYGNTGNDLISIDGGVTGTVYGGQGDDTITASGANYLSGDLGNDAIQGGGANETILGGGGDDTIRGAYTNASLYGNAGNDLIAVSGSATIYAGAGNDVVVSSGSAPQYISGDLGDDTLTGGSGGDTIVGGAGADVLQGDPTSSAPHAANTFLYLNLSDSVPTAFDRILDFDPNKDTINIAAIDAARAAAGQAAFHWVAAFDGGAGEAEVVYNAAANTTALMLDADGDRSADFVVQLNGHVTQGGWLVV